MKGKTNINRVNGAAADNGTEVVTVLSPEEAAATPGQEVTAETVTETSRETPVIALQPVRTVEERLAAFQALKGLTEKRERIHEKHGRLTRMRRANESEAVAVEVCANDGLTLEIKHTGLIEEVLDLMGQRLSEALREVESEILSLEV